MHIAYFIVHAIFWSLGFFFLFRIPRCTGKNGKIFERHTSVSIIIPVRNEETSLPRLLESIQQSDPLPDEIVVVVGESEDRTREVATEQKVTVIDSEPLPDGWIGKPWACYQGARMAKGEILVFLDADTCIENGGLRDIIGTYSETASVMSVQPYHRTRSLYEQLSGFFHIAMMGAMGPFTVIGKRVKPIGLFGPCVVIRRELYFECGGHAAVKGEVVEDLALGNLLRKRGLPVHCYGGKGTISFRMYPNGVREMVDGWSKGFATGAGKASVPLLIAITAWIGSGISATMCAIDAVAGMHTTAIMAWSLAYLAYAVQVQWMFFRLGTFRFCTALLFPVPLLFFIVVFLRSVFLIRIKRSVRWKGITISLKGETHEP